MKNKEYLKRCGVKELLKLNIKSSADLMAVKRRLAKKYGIKILRNSDILEFIKNEKSPQPPLIKGVIKILRKRAVRTLSGVAPVAVLVKPFPCPGKCAYCPTEKDVPKSYLSNEPAVMRAIRCDYNPYKQVQLRLRALEANGHKPTKIELIVIGGTWSVLPEKYKYWYIKECFRAANDYKKVNHELRIMNYGNNKNKKNHYSLFIIHDSVNKLKRKLSKEQKCNEKTKYKIIGLTLETRPDYIDEKEILEMRELGCTRVELGVQAVDDEILKKNLRGHGIKEITEATKMLKDFGFKVTYHIMPGLSGSTPSKDLKMFKALWSDERFKPDQIKFYPTVVTRGSLLYRWWRAGKYKPYSNKALENLIIDCKKAVPEYVRIVRLIRDIPAESIIAGNKITNLRQIMQQKGVKCKCIRCREIKDKKIKVTSYELRVTSYEASGGDEYFIQAESKDGKTLYGFCRLRLPQYCHCERSEAISVVALTEIAKLVLSDSEGSTRGGLLAMTLAGAALIRELHVYGELVPVGRKKIIQHAGLGKKLMAEAEKIARRNGYNKIVVIAGVGARGYYRKLGYKLEESYMVKNFK
jgi:elongator complex protein 3